MQHFQLGFSTSGSLVENYLYNLMPTQKFHLDFIFPKLLGNNFPLNCYALQLHVHPTLWTCFLKEHFMFYLGEIELE